MICLIGYFISFSLSLNAGHLESTNDSEVRGIGAFSQRHTLSSIFTWTNHNNRNLILNYSKNLTSKNKSWFLSDIFFESVDIRNLKRGKRKKEREGKRRWVLRMMKEHFWKLIFCRFYLFLCSYLHILYVSVAWFHPYSFPLKFLSHSAGVS